jgi:23S rRNA (uridine2552-2'-O)-methyltransferase
MAKNWVQTHKHDKFYKKAKREGYRSRASYKLIFMQERFGILTEGDAVLDLGASPGGWSQVAREFIGTGGVVIGVDLQRIAPIPGMKFIEGDINDEGTINQIRAVLGSRRANVVISDMSPSISGNYSMDHARSVALCERALEVAGIFLAKNGNFAVKIFQGDLYGEFLADAKRRFRLCQGYKPKASRSESSELYVVAKGFIS